MCGGGGCFERPGGFVGVDFFGERALLGRELEVGGCIQGGVREGEWEKGGSRLL